MAASEPSPRRRRRGRRTRCAVAVAVAAVLTGCSVQAQDHPVALPSAAAEVGTPSAGASAEATGEATIFLVRGVRLVRVHREVSDERGLAGILDALGRGATESEAAVGLQSALPSAAGHWKVSVRDGVATVQVPPGFEGLGLVDQILAVGQLVYTVTSVDGVDSLQFVDGDAVVDLPVGSGQLVSRPLVRGDFPDIAPR